MFYALCPYGVMMLITKEFLMNNRTIKGSWTRAQIEALGISWPPRSGWHEELIGSCISDRRASAFVSLKNMSAKKVKKLKREKGQITFPLP